jgi:hypothetical protein
LFLIVVMLLVQVSVLEQELRTVRAALEDTTQRFDDNLAVGG